MPVVSVVMAVKNAEATLERSVNSILSQNFTNFEFLIADDFSSDNTPAILASFDDERIIILKAPKPGLVNALNACLNHSKGKYIARMDADDYSHPDRLRKQVELLEKDNTIGVVSGLVNHVATEEKQEGYALHVDQINKIIKPEEHFINRFRDSPIANPSAMFRTSLLKKFGAYKEFDGPEDYEFWLRLLEAGVLFKKLNSNVLDWYDYSYRLTRNDPNYSNEAFFRLKALYFSAWWKNQNHGVRQLWVWGFGKEVFNKSKHLEECGLKIEGYIDVKKRESKRKSIHYEQINKRDMFVLVYVSDRSGMKQIENWLTTNKWTPAQDYYFMT